MIKITHNSRCSKSRNSLEILKNSGVDFEVVNYLDGDLNKKELENILEKLNFSAEEIVRRGEKVFVENFKEKSKTFSEND